MWLLPHFDAAGNLLRFDQFMELALYDPGHGYYSSTIDSIGARGDFATSATLSGLLADGLANWIRNGRPRNVIEVGAGSGQVAKGILDRTGPHGLRRRLTLPRFRTGDMNYHIVERSPLLQKQQVRLLGRRARWHATVPDALEAAGRDAFLFSNELVDAFPVRVFAWGGDSQAPGPASSPTGWHELHLRLSGGEVSESFLPSASLPDSTAFSQAWPEGQRIEVHESYHDWLSSWQTHWRRGELLTIDYGGSAAEIYHRLPRGSLRSYYHHERATGPELYSLPGRRDLTADVNFDDLVSCAGSLGLETLSLKTQRDFLLPHFDPASSHEADRFLLDESGPGTAFKVLRQRRA